MKSELSVKTCNKYQQFKKRKNIYGQLPQNIIAELKLWNSLHNDIIGPHYRPIIQHHPGGAIIKRDVSLTTH